MLFKQTAQNRVLRRLIWVCTVCQCPSPGFTDNLLYIALWRQSDKNSPAVNNRYLDFVQTRDWILLVYDNHVDKNLKDFLCVCMYSSYDSIVNILPKTRRKFYHL